LTRWEELSYKLTRSRAPPGKTTADWRKKVGSQKVGKGGKRIRNCVKGMGGEGKQNSL